MAQQAGVPDRAQLLLGWRTRPVPHEHLRRGAALVLTLKQPTATNKHADGEFAEVLAALAEHGFAGPRIAWLWANGRHERTLGATYEPGAGAS